MISFTSSVRSQSQSSVVRGRREDIEERIGCVEAMTSLMGCSDVDEWSRGMEAASAAAGSGDLVVRANAGTVAEVVRVMHGKQVRGI